MRLFLLPVSTRRTLIYCERVRDHLAGTAGGGGGGGGGAGSRPPLTDRVTTFANETWAKWERAEGGWQRHITAWGNQLLKRIPYEEWGLKSLPPATRKIMREVEAGKRHVECLYPGTFMGHGRVGEVLRQLATERQSLHRRRLWACIAWMPVTVPFQIVPIIPNIPFYYLAYRAWSHYRALYGGKMLEFLVTQNLVKSTDSQLMRDMYTAGLLHPTRPTARAAEQPTTAQTEHAVAQIEAQTNHGQTEVMLLRRWNGKLIAEAFHLPEMEVEIERAVEQVESAIKKAQSPKEKIEARPAPAERKKES